MYISVQGKSNAATIGAIENLSGGTFINEECFKGKADGHKFKEGKAVELFGLENYPQFNGEIVVITSIRENGIYGKAYYFRSDNEELLTQLNWTYEYRLRRVPNQLP